MTLWDLLFRWLGDHRPRRRLWMATWPQWTKAPRFNIIQRYVMRRALFLAVLLVLFKVNPFHPFSIGVTLLGTTLVMQEHRTHRDQYKALFHRNTRRDHW